MQRRRNETPFRRRLIRPRRHRRLPQQRWWLDHNLALGLQQRRRAIGISVSPTPILPQEADLTIAA